MAEAKAKSAPEQDPSMEEILQSIRRIIAEEDKDAPAGGKVEATGYNTTNMDISSDVLELTEIVPETPAASAGNSTVLKGPDDAAKIPGSDLGGPVDVLANIDNVLSEETPDVVVPASAAPAMAEDDFGMMEEEIETKIIPAAAPKAEVQVQQFEPEEIARIPGSTLLAPETSAAAGSSLRKVVQSKAAAETHPTSGLAFRSGTTVEDLVLECIRPMMKEWLDNNLTAIVERIVEKEVKRLAQD